MNDRVIYGGTIVGGGGTGGSQNQGEVGRTGDMHYSLGKKSPRETLIEYLRMKVDECDWHAASDAANDLRVLEAKLGK